MYSRILSHFRMERQGDLISIPNGYDVFIYGA